MSRTLVFTLALNGYQWRYSQLIKTHNHYASKHGYEYVAVTRPRFSMLGLEVAWLKIKLIQHALRAGYDWVMFLDADTQVSQSTPSIQELNQTGKSIYMGEGFSGRINSGVIIIKNSLQARTLFTTIINRATDPIPTEDDVGWGENGHIIHYAKNCDFVAVLDSKWNNNHDKALDDYIRHYSRGPLYEEFQPTIHESFLSGLYHYALAVAKRLVVDSNISAPSQAINKYRFNQRLNTTLRKVLNRYPQFG